jgi:hypothetical protein
MKSCLNIEKESTQSAKGGAAEAQPQHARTLATQDSQPDRAHAGASNNSTLDASLSHSQQGGMGTRMEGEIRLEGARKSQERRRRQSEVLHRVLYPNAHGNGNKKKKRKRTPSSDSLNQSKKWADRWRHG